MNNIENFNLALLELNSNHLSKEIMLKYQVLCLPENFGHDDNLVDVEDSINLSKILKQNNINCANSYDLNIDANTLERRSHDIWFGQIYIIDTIILPATISLLINYITNKLKIGQKKEINIPQPQVNIEIKYLKNGRIDSLKYKGDGETLINVLKNIEKQNNE